MQQELAEYLRRINEGCEASTQEKADVDALLDELEGAIPQGVPNDTGRRRRADDPRTEDQEIDELDALLADSVNLVQAAKRYRADREAQKKNYSGLTPEDIAFCNARMHAFEMQHVWKADYAISVWQRFCCTNCDTKRMVFSRFMEHHIHRGNPTTSRWLTVKETQLEAMPVKEDREVPTCPRCSEWDLDPRLMSDLSEVLK